MKNYVLCIIRPVTDYAYDGPEFPDYFVRYFDFKFNYMIGYKPYHCVQSYRDGELVAAWKIKRLKKITI
jgi:hypothetical protein